MLQLPPIIERIYTLLKEDTEQSLTYAALEARLALEKVCYDRLRQRHDYISHDQLRRWQPRAIVNTLMSDVDKHIAQTMTLMVSTKPFDPEVKSEDHDYVEVGTEIGFDPKHIASLWNALSRLALHVRLPEHRNDQISAYGDKQAIRAKVEEAVSELSRLAKGTMTFSGLGEEVSFECSCGEKNCRRAALLRENQIIHCFNPECMASFVASRDGDEFIFEAQTVDVNCERCQAVNLMPWRFFRDMKTDQVGSFSCHTCRHRNFVQWRLTQIRPEAPADRKMQGSSAEQK